MRLLFVCLFCCLLLILFVSLFVLKVEKDNALLQHWVLNFFELVSSITSVCYKYIPAVINTKLLPTFPEGAEA